MRKLSLFSAEGKIEKLMDSRDLDDFKIDSYNPMQLTFEGIDDSALELAKEEGLTVKMFTTLVNSTVVPIYFKVQDPAASLASIGSVLHSKLSYLTSAGLLSPIPVDKINYEYTISGDFIIFCAYIPETALNWVDSLASYLGVYRTPEVELELGDSLADLDDLIKRYLEDPNAVWAELEEYLLDKDIDVLQDYLDNKEILINLNKL